MPSQFARWTAWPNWPWQYDCPEHPVTMATTEILALDSAIGAIVPRDVLIQARQIAEGDEFALLPGEAGAFATSVVAVRRASGTARMIARDLLLRLGHSQPEIAKAATGAPIWPKGIVGSIAHDARLAIAMVASEAGYQGLGVDIEPAEKLDLDLLGLVATSNERQRIKDEPFGGRLLFAVKEAVYKAVFPLDGVFLDHQDVEVCLATGTAVICNGRIVKFRYCVASHIVAVAFVAALPMAS